MSEFNLNDTLRQAKVPERSPEYWQDFPRQVTSQLHRPSPARTQPAWMFPRLAWAAGFALLCLVIGFAIGSWHSKSSDLSGKLLENTKLIRETLAMFPNRVRAITLDNRGLNLILSDHEDIPSAAPLYVEICDGKQCSAVITFSGQEINIAGQKLTVLSDANNGVILEGPQFAWSSTDRVDAKGGFKIQARQLAPVTM